MRAFGAIVTPPGFPAFRVERVTLPNDGRSYLEVVAEDKLAVGGALNNYFIRTVSTDAAPYFAYADKSGRGGRSAADWAGEMRSRGYGTLLWVMDDQVVMVGATKLASDAVKYGEESSTYVLLPPPDPGWVDVPKGAQPSSPAAVVPTPSGPGGKEPAPYEPDPDAVAHYKLGYWLNRPVVKVAAALAVVGGIAYWWSRRR